MTEQELFNILALLKVDGVGDVLAKKLINHCGSAENVFKSKSKQLENIEGIGTILLQKLNNKTVFEKAEIELKYIKNNSIQVLYFKDKEYPEN